MSPAPRVSPLLADAITWRPAAIARPERPAADWLRDRGSLTHRLRACGRFAVEPLGQSLCAPRADEARMLGLAPRRWAWIRQVLLTLDGTPVVYARSVLPLTSLKGANRRLAQMRRQALGMELFRPPAAHRAAVWMARVPPRVLPTAVDVDVDVDEPIWGRQSLFYKRDHPLLVAEFFLPALWRARPPSP